VWAEENSRDALFEAMRRKETFATSGTRIIPRFFGGWGLPDTLCDNPSFEEVGYDQGVPMGGDLFDAPEGAAPKFIVHARQDAEAAPLQRIQIIKGWIEDGEYQVEVHEVAGKRDNGASVDLGTCKPQGGGFPDLCKVWEDPDFDPSERAYYYARIIENPTCRWTTIQCVASEYDCENPITEMDLDCCDPTAGLNVEWCDSIDCTDPALPPADAQCCKPRVEPIIQERAWTSPIWYSPEAAAEGPVDTSGIAEECIVAGEEFQQEATYKMICQFEAIDRVFDLELTITVKASVEPGGVLTEGVETNVTHSAEMLAPLIATLPTLAPYAEISIATVGLAVSNAVPAQAQNELEGTPLPVVAGFSLNTVDTPMTADGAGPVTLDLVAYELAMTGLVTADGMELVPGGESQITQGSEECTPIALAPDSEAISFEVVSP
jgi:hypothetical protein